jgi:hypothetical protein
VNWQQFATASPELAAIGQKRLEGPGLALVGTLRKDGWPRISPVEPFIVDAQLLLGMMWRSKKALDLLRDPRMVVHSVTSDREGTAGDFKLYGLVTDVTDAGLQARYADVLEAKIAWRPAEPYHLFGVDVRSAAYIVFGRERFAMRWDPARGFRRWTLQAG